MTKSKFSFSVYFLLICNFCWGQNVPIDNYSVNNFGQVQLEIQAQADKYYLLKARHEPNVDYESLTSMTMGVDGTLIITEPGGAYDVENYSITEHSIANPDDADGDGIDDITEFNDLPTNAPLNFAKAIPFEDGTTAIGDAETFASMAVVADVPWAPFLNGQQFVKFGILDIDTDEPKVYFINSNRHFIHANFFKAIQANVNGDDGSGEIVFNPNEILSNGAVGSYSFNFSFGDSKSFEATQKTYELLIANMPFLRNNMQHFIGSGGEVAYGFLYKDDYVGSRIPVVLESEVFSDIDFIPFNQAEGFGFFKQVALDENPGSRDIVLYDALPNSLPRVGGIITSVIQTPLSHVNLRAIQDNAPNAYIKEPLLIDSIANLLNNYIYYRVENDNYFIREASLDEVNDWYEKLRPTEAQIPNRDLSRTKILPLDSIEFDMSTAFGAKCSNVATMRRFGLPEGTIPNGFGIPFYFYDEFMKFNNFYEAVEEMITDPEFITDLSTRIDMLKDLRKDIKAAPMPQWMLDELQDMHDAFPEGTSVRCRSSTNNEDLPGFSGAGLYTSKTQHPSEGHISKSVKQVYASMWNFRAYDERDFYRVDQYIAAMGILCHPNFENEKSNGVGVSIDPIYQTANTFYLNTQVGESLITNPDENSIPEELLLYEDPEQGYVLLRESNLVDAGDLVMDSIYLNQMRDYLKVIHDEFAVLYDVVGAEGFGMDIEYKVTAEDQLIIKQARPWVSFWADINANYDLGATAITYPQSSASLGDSELVTARIANQGLNDMTGFDISLLVDGQFVETITVPDTLKPFNSGEYQFTIPQDFSDITDYNITAIVKDTIDGYANNDTINFVLKKLHAIEGGISIVDVTAQCAGKLDVNVRVTNYGESTFVNTEIELVVNGIAIDTSMYNFEISYLEDKIISIPITESLQQTDNEIVLNLLSINGVQDALPENNTASTSADIDTNYDVITFVINPDNFPEEVSWLVYDELNNEVIAAGALTSGTSILSEEICVDYSSCLSVTVFDSYGDGLGNSGDFSITDASGNTLVSNDDDFSYEVQEFFCPNEEGCLFTADIATANATDEISSDGVITITPTMGLSPYEYSINGGQSYSKKNIFENLASGEYDIMVKDASETCFYEETVTLNSGLVSSHDAFSADIIKVYPNPTKDNLTIEIDATSQSLGTVVVEVYDYLRRLIQTDTIANDQDNSKKVISLNGYSSGTYLVKCYSETFEQHFKVIKI